MMFRKQKKVFFTKKSTIQLTFDLWYAKPNTSKPSSWVEHTESGKWLQLFTLPSTENLSGMNKNGAQNVKNNSRKWRYCKIKATVSCTHESHHMLAGSKNQTHHCAYKLKSVWGKIRPVPFCSLNSKYDEMSWFYIVLHFIFTDKSTSLCSPVMIAASSRYLSPTVSY